MRAFLLPGCYSKVHVLVPYMYMYLPYVLNGGTRDTTRDTLAYSTPIFNFKGVKGTLSIKSDKKHGGSYVDTYSILADPQGFHYSTTLSSVFV